MKTPSLLAREKNTAYGSPGNARCRSQCGYAPWDDTDTMIRSKNVLEVLGAGVVVEMETAQAETVGEAPERVQAVGFHEKAFGFVPDPPEA